MPPSNAVLEFAVANKVNLFVYTKPIDPIASILSFVQYKK